MKTIPLPYFNERPCQIDTIVIHCLAHDLIGAINSFHEHQVSSHYLIDENGKIYRFVEDDKRAWHAGVSFWKGCSNLNDCSIGIELCSKSFGQSLYPLKQIKSLMRLLKKLKYRYHIKKERILAHSDIAPMRKADPGKAFDWKYLARHNLGVWYQIKNAGFVCENDEQSLLAKIGYDTTDFKAAKCAFVRHYMGEFVANDTLERLLKQPFDTPLHIDQLYFLSVLKARAYCEK